MLPEVTVNVAVPRFPAVPAKPGKVLRTTAVLFLGGNTVAYAPITFPAAFLATTVTVTVSELGFAIEAAVV